MSLDQPTPETDAATRTFRGICGEVIVNKIVSSDFARKLERARDEARKAIGLLWTCDKCGDQPYPPSRERLIGMGCVCGGTYRRVKEGTNQ